MKRLSLIAALLVLWACSPPAPTAAPIRQVVQATSAATACSTVGPSASGIIIECLTSFQTDTPTPTAPPTATPTPSATPSVVLVPWHPPGAHLDPVTHHPLNAHEHGDAPPAWVLTSGHTPFTQTRESHQGYKGTAAQDRGGRGVESYLITHILSTVAARAHGDHDYQLWIKTPITGTVSYWSGQMDFGRPPVLPLSDTGVRPIIFSLNDDGCETWYGARGFNVFDIGWTICGRYQNFAGSTLAGNGSYRGMDWIVPCNRIDEFTGGDPDLKNFCTVEFGINRLTFVVQGHQYPDAGVVPIN